MATADAATGDPAPREGSPAGGPGVTLPDAGSGSPVAGWYRDPRVPFQLRWWDGEGWSNNVHMPDRTPQPTAANLVPEFAPQPDGKWEWPQDPAIH